MSQPSAPAPKAKATRKRSAGISIFQSDAPVKTARKKAAELSVFDHGMDLERGIDCSDPVRRGISLGSTVSDVGLHIESLPLEVGQLDDVTIDQGERTDPGTSELVDGEGTQGTTTDNHDVGGGQRVLTA